MIPKTEQWSIVVLGLWNARIFSPEWVACNLFVTPPKEMKLEAEFSGSMSLRLKAGPVQLTADNNRLVVTALEPSDEALRLCEDMVLRAIELLPHTPIQGAGVNFGFSEIHANDRLLSLFKLPDIGWLSTNNYSLQGTTIGRVLKLDATVLTIRISQLADEVGLHLNYHRDARSGDAVKSFLSGQVVALKDRSYEVLKTVYELTPDEQEISADVTD